MALIAVGSAEGRTSQGFMSRLTNSLLAVVMALGYLVATLGVTSVVMTAGASTAQARRRGRGRRRFRRRRRGRFRRGRGFYYGFPFFAAPYFGYYGYRGSYCGRVSRRCRRYGGSYRRCMWHHGC